MAVILDKTYTHLIPIDHWEKDDLGYRFMVDSLGRKWYSEDWKGTNHYYLDLTNKNSKRKVVRTMKQKDKFMEFLTYNTEDIKDEGYITGWTVSKTQIMAEYMFSGTNFAKDAEVIILETLLK